MCSFTINGPNRPLKIQIDPHKSKYLSNGGLLISYLIIMRVYLVHIIILQILRVYFWSAMLWLSIWKGLVGYLGVYLDLPIYWGSIWHKGLFGRNSLTVRTVDTVKKVGVGAIALPAPQFLRPCKQLNYNILAGIGTIHIVLVKPWKWGAETLIKVLNVATCKREFWLTRIISAVTPIVFWSTLLIDIRRKRFLTIIRVKHFQKHYTNQFCASLNEQN